MGQNLEPAQPGELDVEQDDVDAVTGTDINRLLARGSGNRAHPSRLNDHLDRLADARVIVGDEDRGAANHDRDSSVRQLGKQAMSEYAGQAWVPWESCHSGGG